ncbi:putative glycosyl tranferase A family protein [Candidatus Termititenax aidoneus]|uniref:Glycosyl tranferase A family protein n=1 Tax=Termititenax aidoneus TaxID=2218524 RepID=A0A388TAT8_TERA1|nr:putative glycosyl tranferase A family protein [Candidatus Termititenax aidoneus]
MNNLLNIKLDKNQSFLELEFPESMFCEEIVLQAKKLIEKKYAGAIISYEVDQNNYDRAAIKITKSDNKLDIKAVAIDLFSTINNYPNYYPYKDKSAPANVDAKQPLLTCIIVVAFNELFVLNQTIPSILANTKDIPFEIIIVGNDSVSKADLFKHLPVKYIDASSAPFHVSRAYNLGIKSAQGQYIAILHDDAVIDDVLWAEKCIKVIDSEQFILLSATIQQRDVLGSVTVGGTPLLMFRAALTQKYGLFDENIYIGFEENEYSARMLANNISVRYTPCRVFHMKSSSTAILFNHDSELFKILFSLNIMPKKWIGLFWQFFRKKNFSELLDVADDLYLAYCVRKYQPKRFHDFMQMQKYKSVFLNRSREYFLFDEWPLPNNFINSKHELLIIKTLEHLKSSSMQSIIDFIFAPPRRLEFDFELSSKCTARCGFCPRIHLQRDNDFMPTQCVCKVLSQIPDIINDYDIISIGFAGLGEPLLNKQGFFAILDYVRTMPYRAKLKTTIVTNNTLIDADFISNPLLRYLNSMVISAAGYSYADYVRQYNQPWPRTLANILELRKRWPRMSIKVAAVNYLDQAAPPLKENEIFLSCQENQIWYENPPLHGRGGYLYKANIAERRTCQIYSRFVFISSDGNYLSCCNDLTQENILGKVAVAPLSGVLAKKKCFDYKNPFPLCKTCDISN